MKNYRLGTTKKPSKKRKIILIVGAVLLFAVLTTGILEATGRINLLGKKQGPKNPVAQGDVNLEPPTEEEKKAGDEQKEAIVKQQDQPSNPSQPAPNAQPGSKKSVKPIITRTGGGEVSGFVPGIVEDGGTCTATFKSGANTVTKTSSAFANVSNTTCAPVSYAGSSVAAGWSVTLTYSSSTSEGVSDAVAVQ